MTTMPSTIGERVVYRRRLLGLSQKELGEKVGVSQQAIEKIEKDTTKRPRKFVELSDALGLEPYELLNGTTPERLRTTFTDSTPPPVHDHAASSAPTPDPQPTVAFSDKRDLPVMGRAQGGPDGNIIINDDPIDWTLRPPRLSGVQEAFAIYVTGDSMSPKYEDGDLLYVHPNLPIKKGRYVVIETRDLRGLIKQFQKWEGDELVISQYNPAKEIRINKQEIKRVMLVIGSMDG